MADAKNAYNKANEEAQRKQIRTLEGLYVVVNTLSLEKRRLNDEIADAAELMTNWAYHIVTLNNHAYNIKHNAD